MLIEGVLIHAQLAGNRFTSGECGSVLTGKGAKISIDRLGSIRNGGIRHDSFRHDTVTFGANAFQLQHISPLILQDFIHLCSPPLTLTWVCQESIIRLTLLTAVLWSRQWHGACRFGARQRVKVHHLSP